MSHYHKLDHHFAAGRGSDQLDYDFYSCDQKKVTTQHYGESRCWYCKTPLAPIPMWVYRWKCLRSGRVVYERIR